MPIPTKGDFILTLDSDSETDTPQPIASSSKRKSLPTTTTAKSKSKASLPNPKAEKAEAEKEDIALDDDFAFDPSGFGIGKDGYAAGGGLMDGQDFWEGDEVKGGKAVSAVLEIRYIGLHELIESVGFVGFDSNHYQ